MKTECSTCIFETSEGDGCAINRIEYYQEQDITIKRDKQGSAILKDFLCPFHRAMKWFESKDELFHYTAKELEKYILEENGFPYSYFVYDNGKVDIESALDEVLNLDHKPKYIHICFRHDHKDQDLLIRLSQKIEPHKIRYRLNINLNKFLDHLYESFLVFRLNNRQPFVAISFDNVPIRKEITTEISEKIHYQLLSFPYAHTENNEFMLFHKTILEEYINIEGSKFIDRIIETQCMTYKL